MNYEKIKLFSSISSAFSISSNIQSRSKDHWWSFKLFQIKRWHKVLVALVLELLFISVVITKIKNRFDVVSHLLIFDASSDDKDHEQSCRANVNVSLKWHLLSKIDVNDLKIVIDEKNVYDFIFNFNADSHNTYNYCNLSRVHSNTFSTIKNEYKFEYVEIIHRHHKRISYVTNAFLVEEDTWFYDDERLFFDDESIFETNSTKTHWRVYASNSNFLTSMSFVDICQYSQIIDDELIDSRQHDTDIKKIYQKMLHFLLKKFDRNIITYRIINNIITSQVAFQIIVKMWSKHTNFDHDLLIQQSNMNSLKSTYACNVVKKLYDSYDFDNSFNNWITHLSQFASLKKRFDKLFDVKSSASDWSNSWNHYFDNLSTRFCHQKKLSCNIENSSDCVIMKTTKKIFKLNEYEYNFIYRDFEKSLRINIINYEIWVSELVHNLRIRIAEFEVVIEISAKFANVRYKHNFAHDDFVARLLSILQIDQIIWFNMSVEVIFEFFSENSNMNDEARCYYLKVFWND